MKRSELEKYLGKHVRITLDNGRVEEGYLYKTRDEKFKNNPNLYFPQKRNLPEILIAGYLDVRT